MIRAEYKNGMVTSFIADDDADLSAKPINDPKTGKNKKYGEIQVGCSFVFIGASGLRIFKFRQSINDWQEI